ncbi:MAG: sortase [Rubrobacteraceae bacterium]
MRRFRGGGPLTRAFGRRPVSILAVSVAGMLMLAFSTLAFGLQLLPGAENPGLSSGPLQGQDRERSGFRIEVAGSETRTQKDLPPKEPMKLTVPRLAHVADIPVTTAPAQNDRVLDAGALHVEGTGFPWQRDSNVYIAGHRLGYPGTGSYLLFYDLPKLREGDLVQLNDASGRAYRYKVFRRMEVAPDETAVMRPVRGKRIVSLQTCTLPNYSHRIVVQAQLSGEG